jgi:excisionase family DNA binding protein
MFLTVEQAAKELHANVDTVRRKAAEGSIPARKFGRRWLFDPEQLRQYVRGEWRSTNEAPAVPGGLDSQLAVRLFAEAPAPPTKKTPQNTKQPFGIVTGGKQN